MSNDHSFDIISKIDHQEVDNAIQQAKKEIDVRFDLKDSNTSIELLKNENQIKIQSADGYKLKAVGEIFRQKLIKRNIPIKACVFEEPKTIGQGRAEQLIKLQQGLAQDQSKQIVKSLKDTKIKVQVQINGEKIKVTSKKIDDLQEAIHHLRTQNFDFHFGFHINN